MNPRPVRVLRIIDRLNVGGPAIQTTVLATMLDPARFEQRVLVGVPSPNEGDHLALRPGSLAVETVPGLGRAPRPTDDIKAFVHIVKVIRQWQPDIVHTHKAKAGALGRVAATVTGVPATVHTFHGHLLHGYFGPTRTAALIRVERALARRTTRLVAVGARVRDDLLAAGIGSAAKYSVVAPGTELGVVPDRERARELLGLRNEAPVVAFVGRLTKVKRPDRLLAVATRVTQSHPETIWVVAGDGELRDELEHAAADIPADIRFLGWTPDVGTVYSASNVVVLTSDNEGMPVSLIEAAHAGRPSVTTDVGSASEVVVDGLTGFVVPPDATALSDAVDRLLADRALASRMGEAAARRAREMFGPERLAADMAAIYDEVVVEAAGHRRRRGRRLGGRRATDK